MTQHQCTKPCGSIDCAYGCIAGQPWTGSEADSRLTPMTPDESKVVPMMEPPDRIQQAVDHWIDMERKAKAWDALRPKAGLVLGSMMDDALEGIAP